MFSIQIQGGIPIYEQLENRITQLIISGEMHEDEKLPAVREVAKQLAINPNTVQKTYQKLEQRGLIYSIPAKGSYVSKLLDVLPEVKEKAANEFSEAVLHASKQGLEKREMLEILNKMEREGTIL